MHPLNETASQLRNDPEATAVQLNAQPGLLACLAEGLNRVVAVSLNGESPYGSRGRDRKSGFSIGHPVFQPRLAKIR